MSAVSYKVKLSSLYAFPLGVEATNFCDGVPVLADNSSIGAAAVIKWDSISLSDTAALKYTLPSLYDQCTDPDCSLGEIGPIRLRLQVSVDDTLTLYNEDDSVYRRLSGDVPDLYFPDASGCVIGKSCPGQRLMKMAFWNGGGGFSLKVSADFQTRLRGQWVTLPGTNKTFVEISNPTSCRTSTDISKMALAWDYDRVAVTGWCHFTTPTARAWCPLTFITLLPSFGDICKPAFCPNKAVVDPNACPGKNWS